MNLIFLPNFIIYGTYLMIQQLGKGPFGTEWTYNDFVDNLNKHNIDIYKYLI